MQSSGIQALLDQQKLLNQRGNPGLRQQGAAGMVNAKIPGALTTSGQPDMFAAEDNKQFWDNNARLRAESDPEGGSWRASTGPHPSPLDSLRNMSSGVSRAPVSAGMSGPGGGEITTTPGGQGIGNYARGPAESDANLWKQHWNNQIGEAAARDANMSSEDKLKEAVAEKQAMDTQDVAHQGALGTQRISLESGNRIQQAKDVFDPSVYRVYERDQRQKLEAEERARDTTSAGLQRDLAIAKMRADSAEAIAGTKARAQVDTAGIKGAEGLTQNPSLDAERLNQLIEYYKSLLPQKPGPAVNSLLNRSTQ